LLLRPRFCSSHKLQNPFGSLRRKAKRNCAKSGNWGLRTNLSSTRSEKRGAAAHRRRRARLRGAKRPACTFVCTFFF
jgi:hypothetical protein